MTINKKKTFRLLALVLLTVMLFSCFASAAYADNVSFRCYNKTFVFDAADYNNWVGTNCPIQSGNYVKIVQYAVHSLGYDVGEKDGLYGPNTASGIKAFQKAYGLSADGAVGVNTWLKLYEYRGWDGVGAWTLAFYA